MAEDETVAQTIETPTEPTLETPADVTPAPSESEAWQAEKGRLEAQLVELKAQMRGKDRSITTLQRQANDLRSLEERLAAKIEERIAPLYDVLPDLVPEEEVSPAPRTRRDEVRERLRLKTSPTPTSPSNKAKDISNEIEEAFTTAGIDPRNPPEEIAKSLRRAGKVWQSGDLEEARDMVKEALEGHKVKDEAKVKADEAAQQERELKAKNLPKANIPSSGKPGNPMSYEALNKMDVDEMNYEQMNTWKILRAGRIKQGLPV